MKENGVEVEVLDLTKYFGKVEAVKGVSLWIQKGEFFFLLGPSGCGKTTTLRMIAGFERPNSGTIRIGGVEVSPIPPEKRNTGMVFQNWALFPHKTVFDNIAFGLRMRKLPKAEIHDKVHKALDLIYLSGFGDRYPEQLSGGQKQRVALARALVIEPSVLLLDEPLSNLDAKIREQMRLEISSLLKRLGMTAIYVTHDQSEALAMADRIAIMEDGLIKQVGTPIDIYERPEGEFVADFIGDSNALIGKIVDMSPPTATFCTEEGLSFAVKMEEGLKVGMEHKVFLRPGKIALFADPPPGANVLKGLVKHVTYMGFYIRYHVDMESKGVLRVDEQNVSQIPSYTTGQTVFLFFKPENCCSFRYSG